MTELRKAILTRWATNGTLAALSAPWHAKVPAGVAFPHAAYLVIPPPPVEPVMKGADSQRTYYETCVVRFMVYAAGSGADLTVSGYQDTLHTHFDEHKLSLASGGTVLSVYRDGQFVDYCGTDQNKNPVYHAVSTYRYRIEREFPA